MTGMIISDFMDKIYCGDEVEFKINETFYEYQIISIKEYNFE